MFNCLSVFPIPKGDSRSACGKVGRSMRISPYMNGVPEITCLSCLKTEEFRQAVIRLELNCEGNWEKYIKLWRGDE